MIIPTGIIVYNNNFTTPSNIPSGYVANCVARLLPVSVITSVLSNQKLRLDSIIEIDVNIRPPNIENIVNKINLFIVNPYINSMI